MARRPHLHADDPVMSRADDLRIEHENTRPDTARDDAVRTEAAGQEARRRDDLVVEVPSNGPAIGALVTGMLAATLGFLVISAPAAILLGSAAIVLGAVGMGRAKRWGGLLRGTAVSGLISGLLGLLLGLAVVIGGVVMFNQAADDPTVQEQIERLQQEVDRLTVPDLDGDAGS